MGMQGNLHDMTVADLIQHNCQDRKTTQLLIRHNGSQAVLYFKEGSVIHAQVGDQEGEEAVYEILAWEEGTFNLETGIEPRVVTIRRSWSSLLLEGARRLDESTLETDLFTPIQTYQPEVDKMAQKLDDILKEMSNEVNGYLASIVAGMDGLNIAQNTRTKADPEVISAQLTLLLKLVDTSSVKLSAGALEDELITTDNAYILMRFLPDKQYYLGVAVDRRASSLGNLRLMTKVYTDRISKAMPR